MSIGGLLLVTEIVFVYRYAFDSIRNSAKIAYQVSECCLLLPASTGVLSSDSFSL